MTKVQLTELKKLSYRLVRFTNNALHKTNANHSDGYFVFSLFIHASMIIKIYFLNFIHKVQTPIIRVLFFKGVWYIRVCANFSKTRFSVLPLKKLKKKHDSAPY